MAIDAELRDALENGRWCSLFGCIAILAPSWFGWITWVRHARHHHTSGTDWFGIVITGLFLIMLTLCFLIGMIEEIAILVVFLGFPCIALLGMIVIGFRNLPHFLGWLFSKVCIIRRQRYRQRVPECVTGCGMHESKLCKQCNKLISSSSLLTGTCRAFAYSVETHFYQTAKELMSSAENCHLCNILRRSVKSLRWSPKSELSLQQESAPINPFNCREKLRVKIWEKRPWEGTPSLHMQLCGRGIFGAMPLAVEELESGIHDYRIHF